MYKSLILVYEDDGKTNYLKIIALTFKKETLKQFIFDLIKENPQIIVDQSINEIVG
jgi:hypothetical protein